MKKTELKQILEGKKVEMMVHECNDGQKYKWIQRVENSKACPRCKARLDSPKSVK